MPSGSSAIDCFLPSSMEAIRDFPEFITQIAMTGRKATIEIGRVL